MTPRKLGGVVATFLALGLWLPGEGLPRPAAAPQLVAIEYESNAASLVRVDPVSLERVDDSVVSLPRDAGSLMLSPDGTEAASGSNGTTTLHLYDLAPLKAGPSFELARGPGSVWIVAWPFRDRLLALVQSCCSGNVIVTFDPETGRVLSRSRIQGDVREASPIRGGAVLLVARANAIGPARLAVVNADGVIRWVTVARVRVGFRPKPSRAEGRIAEPGLAVDDDIGRVYLLSANGPVAEVRLFDLNVAYHTIRPGARRLAAAQKEFAGPWRVARYVGDGLVAVSGFDGVRSGGGFAFVPAGLMLVDTSDWTVRTIDSATSWFTFASPLLLVLHDQNFVAYDLQGRTRFQLKVEQPLGGMTAIGLYAYVWLSDNRIDVIDLNSGAIVNMTAPKSLTPIAVAPTG